MRYASGMAVAMLMYAQDHDKTLPSAAADFGAVITPYLNGDASLLQGFNYMGDGATLASIDNPSGTIVGSISGPGGAAMIYADGHVKWKDQ